MKKIKTDVIVSCVVLTTSKIPLDKFLLGCSPILFGGAWGRLALRNLFTLQHQILSCKDFRSELGDSLNIKIWNSFIIHSGRLLGKKTSSLIVHLKMNRDTFLQIKNKHLVPKFTIGEMMHGKKKFVVEFGFFEVHKSIHDPLSTTPIILGEQLIPERILDGY